MSWQASSSDREDGPTWLHLAQADGSGMHEFAGTPQDLARSLEQLVNEASAAVLVDGRPARRVVWELKLFDGDHRQLGRKGSSWVRPKDEDDDDFGPHTVAASAPVPQTVQDYWADEIGRLRARVRELEEFQMGMFASFGGAQIQLFESAGKMVEVHTQAGVQLMDGFMKTAEYYFAMRQADMEHEIRAMLEEETGFFDTPVGQQFMESVAPELLNQVPDLLAAFLDWMRGGGGGDGVGPTVTQVVDSQI